MNGKALVGLTVLALLLTACGAAAEETATPEFETDLVPVVAVTGEVLPATWAAVGAQTGGTVLETAVHPGDEVEAGALLVRLDPTDTELAVRRAEAALGAARAQQALLEAVTRPEQIAVADAQLQSTQAAVAQAAAQRDQLAAGTTEAEIAAAQAQLAAAEADEKSARDAYDQIRGVGVHGWVEEEAILRLRAAEEARAAAEAALAQVEGGAGARQSASDAAVWMAASQRDVAQAQLDLLEAGATAEEVAVAEAAVREAEAALELARVALERCEIRAPFTGTVGAVHVREGELIAAGQPVVTLGDLATLRVETTDLDEFDVARVAVEQRADVTFDALPEQVFAGHVARISPMAEPGSGGVHYTVVIELDEVDPAVRWGMTAFVDIEVDQ
jgi:HlyD family secretion protein